MPSGLREDFTQQRLDWSSGDELPLIHKALFALSEGFQHPLKALSLRREFKYRLRLYLSNMGPDEKTFTVTERVPVSESSEVEIKPLRESTSGKKVPDSDGFVTWNVTLKGYAQEQRQLAYTIRQ